MLLKMSMELSIVAMGKAIKGFFLITQERICCKRRNRSYLRWCFFFNYLLSVTIPNSVKSIGDRAFNGAFFFKASLFQTR